MADNHSKLWLQRTLNELANTRASETIQNTGRALPCEVTAVDGPIVTVKFLVNSPQTLPPLTLPIQESQWIRIPIQIGDLGVTQPADTFLGGVSGLGSGTADVTVNYGNMSTLVFVPVGNGNFPTMPDPNRAWVNGPNGFDATDTMQTGGIRYDAETGTVTIFNGVNKIVITTDPSVTVSVFTTDGAGLMQQIIDGATNTWSDYLPVGGVNAPIRALGTLASATDATRSVPAQADLTSVVNGASGVLGNMLPLLMAAVGNAIGSASSDWAVAQNALQILFTASTFVSDISGIAATIPNCSSIVRVAE